MRGKRGRENPLFSCLFRRISLRSWLFIVIGLSLLSCPEKWALNVATLQFFFSRLPVLLAWLDPGISSIGLFCSGKSMQYFLQSLCSLSSFRRVLFSHSVHPVISAPLSLSIWVFDSWVWLSFNRISFCVTRAGSSSGVREKERRKREEAMSPPSSLHFVHLLLYCPWIFACQTLTLLPL